MNEESNSFLDVEGSIWTYLGNGQFRMSLVEPALSPHYQDNMLEVPGKQGGKDDPKSHGGYEEYKKNPVYKRLESAMEILAIGDIHGRDFLSSIEPDNNDKIIFLGDYCDSHCHGQISDFAILENLRQIIEFRKACPHKVVLLLGNHDVHYMYHDEVDECIGFRKSMLDDLKNLFLENADLFDMAYQYKTTLFNHAGISVAWYTQNRAVIQRELKVIRDLTGTRIPVKLAEKLNYLRNTQEGRMILFGMSGIRMFPQDLKKAGGIILADQEETDYDYLKGYHQVVGHTFVSSIEKKRHYHDDRSSITYVNTESREFLELSL